MSRAMKDSGVPWIGSIPQNWETAPIKSAVAWKSVKGHGQATVLSLYRDYGVVPKNSRDDNHNVTSTETDAYKFVEKGDLVINKMKAWQGSMAISQFEGIVSPAYHVASLTNENVYAPYFNYLIRDVSYLPEYTRLSTGMRIGQWDLAFDDFIRIPFLLPPLEEQQRIADFLDTQAAEVNAAIVKTRESIEEYKKLKQAVITQAVTKGIRPNRTMKDSGVNWIGEMPEEWGTVKSKYVVKITHGSDPVTKGETPVYGSGASSFKTCGEYKEGPAVLLGRKGATLHIPHYISGRYWNVDTAFDVKPLSGYVLKHYYYLATSFDYPFYISQTTLPSMTQSNYLNMTLPLLLPEEQQEVVAYLDEKCGAIDALIEKKQQIITELESYKKSLIYEYVTGKKEVPA